MESSLNAVSTRALAGAKLLIVEDNYLLLMDLESVLLGAGADGVQSCRTIVDAPFLDQARERFGRQIRGEPAGAGSPGPPAGVAVLARRGRRPGGI